MFLWLGFGAAVIVLALCIDTIDFPSIPDEQFARVVRWWQRYQETAMKISLKTVHGYLSAQPVPDGHIVRWEYRQLDAPGPWETFDLQGFEPVPPVPPVPPPATWPPAPGTHPPMPPDIDTVVYEEVLERVRWALWNANSSDDESYWMGVIVVHPEHEPGWTSTGYWRTDKIDKGDGVGAGYAWPAK